MNFSVAGQPVLQIGVVSADVDGRFSLVKPNIQMIQIKHVSKICVICVIRVPIKNKFSVVHVRWHRHQPMLPPVSYTHLCTAT